MSEQHFHTSVARLARLTWQTSGGKLHELSLGAGCAVIGRGSDCQITLYSDLVSRYHAEIRRDGQIFTLIDRGSLNGTYVNDERVKEPRQLRDGDRIKIGAVEFQFELPSTSETTVEDETVERATYEVRQPSRMPCLEVTSGSQEDVRFELVKKKTVIGRAGHGQQWDIVLQDRAASRPHAQITQEEDGFFVTDLGSANGTLVNGKAISEPRLLTSGDAILIGETILLFLPGAN